MYFYKKINKFNKMLLFKDLEKSVDYGGEMWDFMVIAWDFVQTRGSYTKCVGLSRYDIVYTISYQTCVVVVLTENNSTSSREENTSICYQPLIQPLMKFSSPQNIGMFNNGYQTTQISTNPSTIKLSLGQPEYVLTGRL